MFNLSINHMKGKTTFLARASMMLLAVLFSLTGARADEFTVYADGEATSQYVPVKVTGQTATRRVSLSLLKQNLRKWPIAPSRR